MKVENVSRDYGAVRALANASFSIEGPGVVAVLGPNGAGKSTLLDLLAGLSRPSAGDVYLFGRRLDGAHYPRRNVGVVLQREFVPDHMSVREYAELFAAIYGVERGADKIFAQAELTARAGVAVARLSGGEAQRLFIATALVHEPRLVVLDEPSAGLDPNHKRALGAVLRRLGRERTVIMSTHDLSEAELVADYCLFMVGATLRAHGPRERLLTSAHASTLEEAFFHYCGARVSAEGNLA